MGAIGGKAGAQRRGSLQPMVCQGCAGIFHCRGLFGTGTAAGPRGIPFPVSGPLQEEGLCDLQTESKLSSAPDSVSFRTFPTPVPRFRQFLGVGWATLALTFGAVVLGVLLATVLFRETSVGVDDANIAMVYARNLAAGHGFVYN